MILIWMIIDQIKWEKECKKNGWEPAVSMEERLIAYIIIFPLPVLIGIILGLRG